MTGKTVWDTARLAEKMRDLDFCVLSTKAANGAIAGRPMSNNRDVAFDGNTWLFADESAHLVGEIEADAEVGLAYQGKAGMLGLRPLFITIEGKATLIRDRAAFAEHWTKDLERWWPEGIDAPGLVLVRVSATRAHYWDGEDEGEVRL
jgi:general stress protein 26